MTDSPSAVWTPATPAPGEVVDTLRVALPGLSSEYLGYLRRSNGGEGDLGVEPGWCQLWPAEEVFAHNQAYEVPSHLPGFLALGTNGGGELILQAPTGSIAMVPAIGMAPEEAVEIATDWKTFEQALGRMLGAS